MRTSRLAYQIIKLYLIRLAVSKAVCIAQMTFAKSSAIVPKLSNTPRIAAAAALSAFVTTMILGCQSSNYRASKLPADLRAEAKGNVGIHLSNLATRGDRSSAISVGDLLDVRVASGLGDSPPEPQAVLVSDQGAIDLPIIGAVTVAGLEPSQAGLRIAQVATERRVYVRPKVTVEVSEQATYQVTVLGAVGEPGVHRLPVGGCNVLSAIAMAGGLTEEAGTEVEVLRQPSTRTFAQQSPEAPAATGVQPAAFNQDASLTPNVQRIDLAANIAQAPLAQHLGDRDVIMVPPRTKEVIYVTGLVEKPDQFELPIDRDVRVLDAISMAGGRKTSVADKIYIVRQRESQQPVVIQVSMARAKKDGNENLILAPGDLVSVESTVATTVVEIVQGFFRVSLGLTSGALTF